jgi:hypothetical protein
VDHRGLQRALFRMQHDPGFARRLREREPQAERSTRLGPAELGWLRAADPAAVAADRDGRRRAQLLRNAGGELALAACVGPRGDGERDWLEAFPASEEFHAAVAEDASLPIAFCRHAARCAAGASRLFGALVELESALARARRDTRGSPAPGPDEVVLAPTAWLVELPDGTHRAAERLRRSLDAGRAPRPPWPALGRGSEAVLIAAGPRPAVGLSAVRAERLAPPVAAFLAACLRPQGAPARAAFARARGLDLLEVEAVARELAGEGVLRWG